MARKRKVPKFRRQGYGKSVSRVGPEWRKPRGVDSKMKKVLRGKGPMAKIGYKNAAALRGAANGYSTVLVRNPEEMKAVDPKRQRALIAGNVGRLNRLRILKAAEDKGIRILNR